MNIAPTVIPTDGEPRRIRPSIALPLDFPANFKARGEFDLIFRTKGLMVAATVGPDLPTTIDYSIQVVTSEN